METFSALLAPTYGELTGHWWIPSQKLVTRSLDVFFDLRGWVNNHEAGDLRRSLWCHCHALSLPFVLSLRWRHNGRDSVSNHQPHDCLLNRLFRRRSKKTSKLRVTGLCVGNSPGTGEFPAQMASKAENVSIWWRHHGNLNIGMLWRPHSLPPWEMCLRFQTQFGNWYPLYSNKHYPWITTRWNHWWQVDVGSFSGLLSSGTESVWTKISKAIWRHSATLSWRGVFYYVKCLESLDGVIRLFCVLSYRVNRHSKTK